MTQAPYRALAVVVLFFIIIVCVRTVLNKYTQTEHLYEFFLPALTLLIEEKPDKLSISIPKNLNTPSLSQSGIKNVLIRVVDDITKATDISNKSVVIDAFTAKSIIGNHQFLTTIDTERTAYFIRSLEMSSREFVEDGVRIGYFGELDNTLIKQLMMTKKSNNTMSSYSLRKITPPTTIDTKTFEDNGVDVLFIFETLGNNNNKNNQGLTRRISNNMKLEVWDYAHTLDIHRLKVSLPFVKHKNIDFSLHFPQLKGKIDIVSSVIAFDNMVMLSPEDASNPNITLELRELLSYYNKPENINLYERYFNVSNVSTSYAKERTQFFLERGSKQILEQFKQDGLGFVFDIQDNVNGFFDSKSKMFYVYSNNIIGIPLKSGSQFKFHGQIREEQNGIFKVVSASHKQSILEKVKDLEVDARDAKRNPKLQPGYLCYNRPDITSKASCESLYDVEGNLKRQRTHWDKPCEKHSECPFYQANKNYKNYRGGCVDGRCEMPIGVKAVSYRLYDKEGSVPLCHNCKGLSPLCCEEQKDKSKYPSLKGPDYAFELDEYERPLKLLSKNLP